ncbi:hypothetical protein COY28_06750 [Candidatus Woesearchaeota archaeon CG_4_10_14_0_2_um_filter_57_5]|nr:MAG: hypothetical protein AUJ68_07170 [Candidatus Woesearchaeota archaeon CG1_02_57_44]PIN68884.1 MAG: hypothetical protein COV94_03640 [Candidatus Woesearchaeota archaeon CG11_big_fil_rev_8_21_14_0_20_57_5]PIZ48953.1 MAG: hypothetical protein COY28_06750 [Candidatus Woesearchaeota archaeon CG_4_10_14_0_2_um_filter_57_5]
MTELVVCAANDKGIKHAQLLAMRQEFSRVIVVLPAGDDAAVSAAISSVIGTSQCVMIKADLAAPLTLLTAELARRISTNELEVALSLYSGPGKLHMAVLGALLSSGIGVRLVAATPGGMEELIRRR